jgi:tetratricopeptide (TPR) repeat protein
MEHSTGNLLSGMKAYLNQSYSSAINLFTKSIEGGEELSKAYLYRAITLIQLKKYSEALIDLIQAESHDGKSFEIAYNKGIVYFNLEEFLQSHDSFKKALSLQSSQDERTKLAIWSNKLEIELMERDLISEIEANTSFDSFKLIQNWYQNATHITITLETNTVIDSDKFDFTFHKKQVCITHKASSQSIYDVHLSNTIIPEQSSYTVNNKRIELKLKKETDHFNWVTVDRAKVEESSNNFKPSYPTSSQKKKDWDNLDKEISQQLNDDAKNDSNEGIMKLFRDIYEKSDENTRKAMMKSFQTSGGTVLSTNWGEVKDKDYEGKDRPDAPKGQEWRKHDV